jgi:hypothetical protein
MVGWVTAPGIDPLSIDPPGIDPPGTSLQAANITSNSSENGE